MKVYSMKNHSISAENLGPISKLGFTLESPGVTVLVAPNGSGKTILLDAVQAAARGEGKLPLRDYTKKGRVEAFGAVITIGGTCRHTGEFEVTNLEGRFDLAGLVDPRIKAPAAADNARIKALVALTGVNADAGLFKANPSFADFSTIVKSASTETDDLVDMARRIKDDYDAAARTAEDESKREDGHATGLNPPDDLDLTSESDSAKLQTAYNAARDMLTRLRSVVDAAEKQAAKLEKARESIAAMGSDSPEAQLLTVKQRRAATLATVTATEAELVSMRAKAMKMKSDIERMNSDIAGDDELIQSIGSRIKSIGLAESIVSESIIVVPTDEVIESAQTAVKETAEAVEQGALIRQAIKDKAEAEKHRKLAMAAKAKAAAYRDAGKSTDEVLSSCIKCPQLRVESDGKAARLVTDTERGNSIPYHDLSDGEKWTLAIDIGADQVGDGGLLVISQVGWEGIDGKNRQEIHHHAIDRGVYILTAEASSDPAAENVIVPTRLVDTDPVADAPVKPVKPSKIKRQPLPPIAEPAGDEEPW